jgi:hypothetical protein
MLTLILIGSAFAGSGYLTSFNSQYGTSATALNTCALCHPAGGGNDASNLNNFARNFATNGHVFNATLDNLDSDGDGFTNIAEINARTFPGDAASFPATGDTTAPTVTAFVIPATSTSLTVSITTFTATDAVGVTGYLLTESATPPLASAAGWTTAPPANFTFATAGSKVLFAWAKDAAGNVPTSTLSAPVVITAPSLQAPGNVAPTAGSINVALSTVLQIGTTFPDATGATHKATDWQISSDAAFTSGILFSSINDSANLTSLAVLPGVLRAATTYFWRARTINSADQPSPYSANTSFTTAVLLMDTATGTVPDTLTVKSAGVPVTDLSTLSAAALAAAGNISPQLVTGPNSVPVVNAGAGANTAVPSMMIVKANGGVGNNVLGIVTPAGTVIESVSTTTTSDAAFKTAPPAGVTLPYGVVSFRISGITPGASIDVTVYTPSDLAAGTMWYKYTAARGWLKIDSTGTYNSANTMLSANTRFSVVGGKGVLTIQDDDVTDFSTEIVAGNAIVLDPGGPAVFSSTDSNNGCFIATAAYGSALDPHVTILREFRDAFLVTSETGKKFVNFYYRVSPDIAKRVGASELLRIFVRILLLPAIGFSYLALHAGMPAGIAMILAFLLISMGLFLRVYRRRRQPSQD